MYYSSIHSLISLVNDVHVNIHGDAENTRRRMFRLYLQANSREHDDLSLVCYVFWQITDNVIIVIQCWIHRMFVRRILFASSPAMLSLYAMSFAFMVLCFMAYHVSRFTFLDAI